MPGAIASTTTTNDVLETVGMAVYICRHTLTTKTLNPVKGFETVPVATRGEASTINMTSIGDTATVEKSGRRGAGAMSATLNLLKTDAGQKALKAADDSGEEITIYLLAPNCDPPTLASNTLTDPAANAINRYQKIIGTVSQLSNTGEQDNIMKTSFAMKVATLVDLMRDPT